MFYDSLLSIRNVSSTLSNLNVNETAVLSLCHEQGSNTINREEVKRLSVNSFLFRFYDHFQHITFMLHFDIKFGLV